MGVLCLHSAQKVSSWCYFLYSISSICTTFLWACIKANPRASKRGGGANLSESAESLKVVCVGTLGESHIGHARGGDLGLLVRSHDEDIMCLRRGECNTPRARRRVVHIEDMEERKQHHLDTFWAECR